ncbi:DUF5103 domain-containing protein [Pseudotenacibaculum sp. MALMAid0570]|uniref:type IX secretion system plug protein n=1 Tax=Pseudotenacibaculum sp. MALMAid0570 TaxID=3143938 RepID=UPI0032DEBFE9
MKRLFCFTFFFTYCFIVFGQTTAPDYIKSIQLKPIEENNFSTIVPLGTILELNFDDLQGDQKDYYYKIQLMNHDWTPSNLISNQYLSGFQSNIIFDVENSFNTFQNYTHYSVRFPNRNTRITKSGNYLVSILNSDDELIFTRRFTLYESKAIVGVSVSRSRNTANLNTQQTVNFIVNHSGIKINNPNQEIHVAILQNQNWKTAITNIQPQFYKPNQLIYRYTRKTNFWGGNQYLFFDNKIIRNSSINVAKVERKDLYHNYLYPYKVKEVKSYTYNPDINGQFIIRTLEGSNPKTEADYAMMHFSLEVEEEFTGKEVYVYGAFNNFNLSETNQMAYDSTRNTYTANILLKQGFYNYTFVTKSDDGSISQAETLGNFSKTENDYTVIVYYKPFGGLFDRVIGVGNILFEGER